MKNIIEALKRALLNSDTMMNNLEKYSTFFWKENYPVAVVHGKERIKEHNVLESLKNKGFIDSDGYTPSVYDENMIQTFESLAPSYVKKVSLMCFESSVKSGYTFEEKRPGDYWKKVVDPGNFKAVVEYSEYTNNEDICKIESDLRDLMRSSKEVTSLKHLPFIWVVKVSENVDISKIMNHYYGTNFESVKHENETIVIGWAETLKGINMRYFVCPPPKV